ncbi:MAG: type II toxin-antitoxin system RelE/ParE family toxin [Ignavibacteria bacterium]|jgi:plasmid stabilization system protein ParE|nr:type II toxin-antitoxin system RelE/ParE family toxin [Ignavibacteria bacterium]
MSVEWLPLAMQQFDEITDYWDERNLSTRYSEKLTKFVRHCEDLLEAYPYLGRPTIYGDIRTILVDGKYNIYYEYDEELDEIHILSFWDGRQNPEKLTELLI